MQQCLLIKHFNHQLNHSKTTVIRDFETFPTQRGNSSQNETRQNRSNSNDLLHKKKQHINKFQSHNDIRKPNQN